MWLTFVQENWQRCDTEPGGTNQARKCGSNRPVLPSDSGGGERYSEQNTHVRRLCDPRQTRPLVDGSALASSEDGATWACSADSCEPERPGTRYQEHFRRARLQETGNCSIQPEAWRPLVGLHEKVPQPRRNSATGTLAQLVKRFALPKASKLLGAMQLVEPRQAEFGRYYKDNLERLLAAPMEGRSFPGLDIDASLRSGMLRRV